jgi:sensor histidine kinase YesM
VDGSKIPPKPCLNHFIAVDTGEFFSDDPPVIHIAVSLKNLVRLDESIAHIGSAHAIRQYAVKTMRDAVRQDIPYFILGGLLFFSGIASWPLFLNHLPHREYPFLSFGFFLLCAGGNQFFSPVACTLFKISPIAVNYFVLCKFLIPVGLIAFFNHLYDTKFSGILWFMLFFFLFMAGVVIITAGYYPLFRESASVLFYISALFTMGTVLTAVLCTKTRSGSLFRLLGFCAFLITTSIEMLNRLGIITWGNSFFSFGIVILVITFGQALMFQYRLTRRDVVYLGKEVNEAKNRILEIKQENLQARFSALKNQIDPHFLFNTLGTLMSLIEKDRDVAVSYVEELAGVYRYILQTKDDELIALGEELDFIRSYLFLIKKRFGENISIAITIKDDFLKDKVPPLSLQLLIENAVKHNVISKKRPLQIKVFRENDHITVRNNLQEKAILQGATGIGLINLQKRYEFITKEKPKIFSDEHYFTVKIPVIKNKEEKNEGCHY